MNAISLTVAKVPNRIIIRGHTDNLRYSSNRGMNNWMLSSARAESTRATMVRAGIQGRRFIRIEGVADQDPVIPKSPSDPRNRRISITLTR